MSISIATHSAWPSKLAYTAAAVFTGASGTVNVFYGISKATDLSGQLVWGGVAAAVAVVFALSWPATIRAAKSRRLSAFAMCLAALLLSGSYSIVAALGAASGGRVAAERSETAATGAQQRAAAAYKASQDELSSLKASRPVAELEALVAGARPVCRVVVTAGNRQTVCAPPAALVAELGRAKRKAELQATIERADERLGKAPPVANSDAAALRRYLLAVGLDVGADRLNDLLVLLAVLMIEAGGGLSLSVAMALSAGQTGRVEIVQPTPLNAHAGHQTDARTDTRTLASVRPAFVRPLMAQPSGVQDWLVAQGGRAVISMRRLASVLGRSPSAVHDELRRLQASGALTLDPSPRGTAIALRPN